MHLTTHQRTAKTSITSGGLNSKIQHLIFNLTLVIHLALVLRFPTQTPSRKILSVIVKPHPKNI